MESQLWAILLPDYNFERIEVCSDVIRIHARMTAASARCPTCQQESHRAHGYYRRQPADLPWAACAVRLHLVFR